MAHFLSWTAKKFMYQELNKLGMKSDGWVELSSAEPLNWTLSTETFPVFRVHQFLLRQTHHLFPLPFLCYRSINNIFFLCGSPITDSLWSLILVTGNRFLFFFFFWKKNLWIDEMSVCTWSLAKWWRHQTIKLENGVGAVSVRRRGPTKL